MPRHLSRSMLITALLVTALLVAGLTPARAAACAPAEHSGGDWPMHGHDLQGTRSQPAEQLLGPDTAGALEPAWAVSTTVLGAQGGLLSTPVIANGCVYVGTSAGWVIAVNADTGELVWKTKLDSGTQGGGSIFGVAVEGPAVHVNFFSPAGPRATALDASGGTVLWTSDPIEFGYPNGVISTAIVWDGKHIVPTQGPDADPHARPGIGIVDASTGAIIGGGTVIPEEDLDRGYAGGGIWTTPVVDPETGFGYAGTANPYSKRLEHEYDNAIVKFDLHDGPMLGRVVDAYKGNVDQFVAGAARQPACDMFGDNPLLWYHDSGFSIACLQLDVDFGGSPTMFGNDRGRLIVADFQKSGVVHAAFADTMQGAWTTTISVPPMATYTAGNSSSMANDGERVYVTGNPGVMWALDVDDGRVSWASPVGDQIDYHSLAVANGVVYTTATHSTLLAYDARTGAPLLVRSLIADTQDFCYTISGGVAVARNSVYAVCDNGTNGSGWLVAYR